MVRLRLATLAALIDHDWTRLQPLLADNGAEWLHELHIELQPKLLAPLEPTRSESQLRSVLGELIESLTRFNRRWEEYVPTVDLGWVNEVRENYNRYFLLEKECAVGRGSLSQQDFLKLAPLRTEDIMECWPPLPVLTFR
jgi:hypothetical protein